MITDLFDKELIKILTYFSISPGSKITRNEIKERIRLNNIPLDNSLNNLINNNILIKEKRFISINFASENAKKIIETIKKEHIRFKEIPLEIYCILIDISEFICRKKCIRQIFLFGSYAKLIYTEKSDIDLAIILNNEDKKTVAELKKYTNKIEKKYNKNIELHFFENKDLKEDDPLIKEILRNGIKLFE